MFGFYMNAAIAVAATAMVVTTKNAVHALLYFVLSLLSIAVAIYTLGSPFAAAIEVIVYAGAIMVLFVFVVMLLNVQPISFREGNFFFPALLASLLIVEMVWIFLQDSEWTTHATFVPAKDVALLLFDRYGVCVELASLLLLAALIGANHLGSKPKK